ncbi:dTDP-4-dehydrorhamnose 3,5-epimerase [Polynucleobacter sp. AP-Sanab-80-C2]|uniref:dTDP-4-dehydrorhamnose 3,5-epimerase n=1 Tax=Polynucleobacter sp. AP-Sanab-80-C2 TaxID=3108274 RepID=UPI002B234733|nr:dTDP-4-dehydrorhamnose 3,5-epimerase [Polynucleobacter sp. AP-Sanab-80-C2]MEA9598555.1 dTDP-4-dehydrorhamnose 3,5-epimerase [Polynucleobacter sp. AP-Sanab-80-C2]
MESVKVGISDIQLIKLGLFRDSRGFFAETYQKERYAKIGIKEDFLQDNHSRAVKNSLRGLHYTCKNPQSQLLTVISGLIYDVVVDLRRFSPTFGKWFGAYLGEDGEAQQIYMPHGFAHGYCVLSDEANLHYKVSHKYEPGDERGLLWSDPDIDVAWPLEGPIIKDRDGKFPCLSQIEIKDLPKVR